MPSADKRARKKENARAAREEREAALRRKKRTRSTVTVAVVVVIFVGVIVLLNATGSSKKKVAVAKLPAGCVSTVPAQTKKTLYKTQPPRVITLNLKITYTAHISTTCGPFDMALNVRDAPNASNSFVFLAEHHFYDGLKFQRVAKNFVVQGGDPKGDGTGGPGYQLATEPPKYGYRQGTVAMANGGAGTTGSQFFIVLNDAAGKLLEQQGSPFRYSALGQVTKGFDVVQKLGTLYNPDQNPNDSTTQHTSVPLYIFKVTITKK